MANKATSHGLGEVLKVLYLDEAYTKVKGKFYWSLDGDQAIASALNFILLKAKSRLCSWHELHNIFLKARELFPNERGER